MLILMFSLAAGASLPAKADREGKTVLPIETVNDYDPDFWEMSGGVSSEIIKSGGRRTAVRFSSDKDFSITGRGLDGAEFMVDFTVDTHALTDGSSVDFSFFGELTFAEITVALAENKYNAKLTAGDKSVTLSGVKYGSEGRIQLRLAYDRLLNLETQAYSDGWNFVAGCDKWTNGQANIYTGNAATKLAMGEIGETLSAFDYDDLSLTVSVNGFTEPAIDITQLNSQCYYDYYLFAQPNVNYEDDVYYNRIAFNWDLPEIGDYPRVGFRVERLVGGEVEETFVFDNAYASSLSENKLAQNTAYEYRVIAFEQVDSVLNAVACYRVAFKYEPVVITTLKGSIWYLVIALISIAVLLLAIILTYVYYYDIRKAIKKKGEQKNAF